MRFATFVLAGLMTFAAASPAAAGNILWFEDATIGTSAVGGAIALTGHTSTYTTNPATLVTLLAAGGWDLVIYGEQNSSTSWSTAGAALTTYVNGGGRVIAATWQASPASGITTLMEGTRVTTNITSIATTTHPIFANLGSTINLVNPGIGTFSQSYTVNGSATGLGTASGGYGVVLGNGGRTLLNAGCMTTYSPISQGQQFIANEIDFLIVRTLTGRVLYDRYVVDSSGIGNTSQQNIPLAGMRVDARSATNAVVGTTFTDADGNFTMQVSGGGLGSLVVCAQNSVTALRAVAAGLPVSATFATSVSFGTSASVGTLTLNEGNDPGGIGRAPIDAARTIKEAYDWARARSTDAIPFLEALYDNSTAPTLYTEKAGLVPASMRISGAAANPDGWDLDVIRKTYARHVLSSIAGDTTIPATTTFDSDTAPENAFAEAFGYAVAALMSGRSSFIDGTSSTATSVLDLEAPTGIQSSKSIYAVAWVTQALHDLVDPANEAWDTADGTGTAGERVFTVVDSLAAAITPGAFYAAWLGKGFDGPSITTNFIHHGLIPDDSDESNDSIDLASPIGQFGFVLTGRVLNLYNHDWYAFTLPEPTSAVTVIVNFNRATAATLLVEITTPTGTVIATATETSASGPYKAVTGALPAGDYRLHVVLASGGPISAYSVQAFAPLGFRSDKFQPWTLGQPYSLGVSIAGGIRPYGLTIPAPYKGPNGLTLHGDSELVDGTPSGPPEGIPPGGSRVYSFLLAAVDSASPPNSASKLITFRLNDRVRSPFGEFIAFTRGKTIDRAWESVGGTNPFTVTLDEGSLPPGLSIVDGESLSFKGTPDAGGSYPCKLTTTDFAGSSAATSATSVVCAPIGANSLAAGPAACGWFFDTLQGSSVSLNLATVKKQPIRTLRAVLLDVDGTTPLDAYIKVKKGKVSISRFLGEKTGRYYCVLAASDSGLATSLVATAKITPPNKAQGSSGVTPFGGTAKLEVPIPALAGAALSFSAKPDKSGLQLAVLHLVDPSGKTVDLPEGSVKSKGGAVSFKTPLAVTGVWKVVVSALAGPSGNFTWSYALKQPKAVVYSAD